MDSTGQEFCLPVEEIKKKKKKPGQRTESRVLPPQKTARKLSQFLETEHSNMGSASGLLFYCNPAQDYSVSMENNSQHKGGAAVVGEPPRNSGSWSEWTTGVLSYVNKLEGTVSQNLTAITRLQCLQRDIT